MRTLFLSILVLCLLAIGANAQWTTINKPAGSFGRVHNRSRDTVVVCGSNTTAAWSPDNGATWRTGKTFSLVTADSLTFVRHIGRNRLIAGHYERFNAQWVTTMYVSPITNTGLFQSISAISQVKLEDAYFFPYSTRGFAVGNSADIYRTTDQGATWTVVPTSAQWALKRVTFADNQTGYAVGELSEVLKTTNGGNSWTRLTSTGIVGDCYAVSFPSPQVGYIGTNAGLYKTTNGGVSFSRISTRPVRALSFYTDQRGLVSWSPPSGGSQLTSDGGQSWNTGYFFFWDLNCDRQGYCYGLDGVNIHFYNNPNPVVSVAETWTTTAEFYPNLLSAGQAVNYYLPPGQDYELQVFGMDGKAYHSQVTNGGHGQLQLQAPAGLYLLKVSAGGKMYTQKLVVQ